MPGSSPTPSMVFAMYPNANGYGFVYMKDARTLIDYGSVRLNPVSNSAVMARVKRCLSHLKPSILIIQDPTGKHSRTGVRVERLIQRIVRYAKGEGLPIIQYSRDAIRDVFEQFGARTKYEISQLLITEFAELQALAPKKRRLWTSEDRYMAIFDALSLGITWYFFND